MAKESVDANVALERQSNDLLLLNILRASHDLPMHFTRVNALRLTAGDVGWNAKVMQPVLASLPVVSSGATVGSVTRRQGFDLGLTGPSLPALDVTPLDGQEFMQGIMSPVSLSTLPVMSELGWPTDLLLFLLVDSVSIKTAKSVEVLQNDPRHGESFKDFKAFVERLKPNACALVPKSAKVTRYTPDYSANSPTFPPLDGVAAAKAAGLAPQDGDNGAIYFGTSSKQIAIDCATASAVQASAPESAPRSVGSTQTPAAAWKLLDRQKLLEGFAVRPRSEFEEPKKTPSSPDTPEITATLRSPYGVLTYLGALMQVGNQDLFRVNAGSAGGTTIARAELFGTTYFIPSEASKTHTTRSLSIAWQLLQLQSKGSTAPVTGTVRLAQ